MPQHFTLSEFRQQCEQARRLGMLDSIGRLVGGGRLTNDWWQGPEWSVARILGMLDAMTPEEQAHPGLIDRSRCQRIALGSGTQPDEVKLFLSQFEQVQEMMRRLAEMPLWERIKLMTGQGHL